MGGVATFAGLTVVGVGHGRIGTGGGTIRSSSASGGLVATSDTVDVVPGAAAQLAITAQPSTGGVTAGSPFLVSVQVEDAFGDPVTAFTGSLAIAMAYNPGGGTLGGILTVTPIQGKANFAGLRITTAS